MTRVIALLGDPVSHSLSPRLHGPAMAALGLDGVYVAVRTTAPGLPGLLRGIAWGGGAGNVTLPHKTLAFASVDEHTVAARETGAVNTFWLEGETIVGDNTDVSGFQTAFRRLMGDTPARSALVIGAGGAARAALVGLGGLGVSRVGIWNRTALRAQELVERFSYAVPGLIWVSERRGGAWDVIVNATSLGLQTRDPEPFPSSELPLGARILDLVYRPEETAWVLEARRRGHVAMDGGLMLVAQGEAAFRQWWGVAPPEGSFEGTLRQIRAEKR